MKFHTERTEIERFGVSSEKAFSIKTTAKAFDILSSGLYTDPILAIVRELSCNAWDAHVAAGNINTPFEIHLPNSLEPWFHVRDFGTGLSDEDVMQLYTTYFDSTKSDSNSFIGALGLGSKSPFSYTKAFEVVSRFNNVRRTYSAFINEYGVPSIARLGETNTDEHNGLEVRITIERKDWNTFAEKTTRALRWFPLKPTVIGLPGFKWLEEEAKKRLDGNGWKIFEKNFANDYSKMTAVQGNVAYKVDISKLKLNTSDTKILENAHVVGFFDIGDLEVAANREEIRYDERSKNALVEKIKSVRAGVLKSIEDQVDALEGKPFWEVMIQLHNIAEQIFNSRSLFKEFVRGTTNTQIQQYIKNGGSLIISRLKGHELSGFEQTHGRDGISIRRRQIGNTITPESNIVVFYNDLPSGGVARAMEWVRQSSRKNFEDRAPMAIVIRPKKDYKEMVLDAHKKDANGNPLMHTKIWTEQDYINELTTLRKELGDIYFLLTSKDAPSLIKTKNVSNKELSFFQYKRVRDGYRSSIYWERLTDVDLQEGGLYFNLQNGAHISFCDATGELKNVKWSVHDVCKNFEIAIEMINSHLGTKYTQKDIYGVGSQTFNKIKKNIKWVNIFDILKQIINEYADAVTYCKRVEITDNPHGIRDLCTNNLKLEFVKYVEALDDSSLFKQAVLPLMNDHIKWSKHIERARFATQINVDLGLKLFDNEVIAYFDNHTFTCYPMFQFISNINYSSVSNLKVLFDYINIIDRS